MAITPEMNLELPTPSVTLGPEWAIELNAALTVIDSHNHSSGFGAYIHPSGLDIDSDLDFQGNKAFNLKSSKYDDQASTLTGATNASSVYSKLGDLWFTNGSGVAVQLTSGSSIISAPSSVESFEYTEVNTDLVIAPSDTFVVLNVDCSAARNITLPSASAVVPGRIYFIKDGTNQSETNTLTVTPNGADTINLAATWTITSDGGAILVSSDGISNWSVL